MIEKRPKARYHRLQAAGPFLALLLLAAHATAIAERLPPSPYVILGLDLAAPPPIDAAALCVPTHDPRLDSSLTALERKGITAALIALGEISVDNDPEFAADLAVLRASMTSRRSVELARTTEAALRSAAQQATTPLSRACAWLELARTELLTGQLADTRASSRRALRAYGTEAPPAKIRRAAAHYRAESLYQSGQTEEAETLYRELATGATPVARAAKLRLADLRYVAQPTSEHRRQIEAILDKRDDAVSTTALWAVRIAEWALSERDAEAALKWLERVPTTLSSEQQLAVSIRRADTLYLLGRSDEGGGILRRLSQSTVSRPQRELAIVRSIDLESPAGGAALIQLRRAADSQSRGVALYARSILANRLAAANQDEAALDLLVGLAYDDAPSEIVGNLPNQFDQILASLVKRDDCVSLLAAAGGRRTMLQRHAGAAEPFLQLGDCYLEFGMPRAARDVYRSTTRTFGPDLAKQITLRSARAEFQIGELDTARAAARSNLQLITVPVREWRLLYGEILIADDRNDDAIRVLTPLAGEVADGSIEGEKAIRVLWLLSHAATDRASTVELRAQLRAGLASIKNTPADRSDLGETLLATAELHRLAGEVDRARALYGDALATLSPGPLRSLAVYWRGILGRDIDEAQAIWLEVAEENDIWALMARNELHLSRTRASLGRTELAPTPPSARTDEDRR